MHRSLTLALALAALPSLATTSAGVASSPMGGNGHNVTFDGRVFIVTMANGWNLRVLRPERVAMTEGYPDLQQGAFTEPVLIQPTEASENALSFCDTRPE